MQYQYTAVDIAVGVIDALGIPAGIVDHCTYCLYVSIELNSGTTVETNMMLIMSDE